MTSLRITTSLGEVVREPDRAALAATITAAGHAGPGAFVVLDGDIGVPDAGDPFLQATRLGGTAWRIEVVRVAAHGTGERFWTFVADDTGVTDTFWSWASGTDAWQHLRWQQSSDRPLAAAG